MNYFEHHIGDYDEATAHLTACEDGIYSRLIRKYYATERPLIADIPKLQRLVRAKSREEKQAVVDVLEEFFHLEDDGWHQDTCDEVIATYMAGEPEREVKKANEDNRLKRHREERARLFKTLTDAGQHAPWNIGMAELRDLVKRATATGPETSVSPLPATAPATPATATQAPDTRHQTPEEKGAPGSSQEKPDAAARDSASPPPEVNGHAPTPAGLVCRAMRRAGLLSVNPGDPRLLALLAQGATEAEFVAIATEAVEKRKSWPWVLAVLQSRRAEAAEIALAPPPAVDPMAWAETQSGVADRAARLGVEAWDGIRPWNAYRRQVIAAHHAAHGATV